MNQKMISIDDYRFDEWGQCLLCRIQDFEIRDGSRVVYQNDEFIGFVPYAAEEPFEIWIVSKRHRGHLFSLNDHCRGELAKALQTLLKRLKDRLGDPNYNTVINSATGHHADDVPPPALVHSNHPPPDHLHGVRTRHRHSHQSVIAGSGYGIS